MTVPAPAWACALALIVGLLLFDFFFHLRTAHTPSLTEAAIWSAAYVGVAVLFACGVWVFVHQNNVPFINHGKPVPVTEISTAASLGVIVVVLLVTVAKMIAEEKTIAALPRKYTRRIRAGESELIALLERAHVDDGGFGHRFANPS